jgi:hypothetical protein
MPARIFAQVMRPAHANRDAVPLPGYFEPDEPAIAYAPVPDERDNNIGGFVDSLRNIFGNTNPEPVEAQPQRRQQQRPESNFSQRQRERMMQTR